MKCTECGGFNTEYVDTDFDIVRKTNRQIWACNDCCIQFTRNGVYSECVKVKEVFIREDYAALKDGFNKL